MSDIRHPAAREESQHLAETLAVIAGERQLADAEYEKASGELAIARRYDPDALPLREMLFARAEQLCRNLSLAARRPYFTRVDFTERAGERFVYYIGKYGVLKSGSLEIQVVDWRSPVANLYYSGQVGPMHYTAPDGTVHGELTLKRQFGIEDGRLQTIFDTDVVSQDAYLQSVLGAMSGDRLREIVTTIQAEQNFVIRHPLSRSLVVQGVAGSGKTTIALHRIAYLLYAFSDRLLPENMLILAPNPLFLNFIAGVLPDLGVERVHQTTFLRFIRGHFGDALPGIAPPAPPEAVLDLPAARRDRVAAVAQWKGSLETGVLLDDWLDDFEQGFPPAGDVRYGPVTLFTEAQSRRFLLVDEKPFPLNRRIQEYQKELKRRARDAAAQVVAWLQDESDRRADRIRNGVPEGEERRQRLTAVYASRDARIAEARAGVAPFVKREMARFPALRALDLYKRFLVDCAGTCEAAAIAAQDAMKLKKVIEPEDAALVALIALRLHELPRLDIRHIVVDEAQDFSALEFQLLSRMTHSATMTIVGDLMQGVRGWRGLTDWAALTDRLFQGRAAMHHLVTSYRNTVEIMGLALRVAARHPTPGQQDARPVLRHGPEPTLTRVEGDAERAREIAQLVRAWRQDGLQTIAVIDRTGEQLDRLMAALPADLGARRMDVDAADYQGGLSLARAADVKGFEFDGVILADASQSRYPDRSLDARLLYVCLTRPLHRLAVLYTGELTPLLREN
ncbi:MAG: UvrD-helicase domain-containing protein [Clostridiales bacterium]|nr:UvrD-helicase domain-containing protein [Clostridiales bacterium]